MLATALATFALASCQSESSLLEPTAGNMQEVELTVIASKDEFTRSNLNLNDEEKRLLVTWNLGDVIHVSEKDGKYKGYLTVTELIDEGKKAKFKGTISVLKGSGVHTFTFISLGKGVEYTATTGATMADMTYDFASQINNGVEALAQNDLLLTDGDVTIEDGKATFEYLFLKRQFAFGRFTLLLNGEPLAFDDNTVVTIEKDDLKPGATLTFPSTVEATGEGPISLTTSENDFYVTLVPGTKESRIKFTVIVDGKKYEGFSNEYQIEKNDYFTKAKDLEKGLPIPIEMTDITGRDDEKVFRILYYQNVGYHPDQKAPNQPKWNLGDLYYSDVVYTTDTEHTFTIKEYDNDMFQSNPLDLSLYDFQNWSSNWNSQNTNYPVGSEVTLSINNNNKDIKTSTQIKDGKTYQVYTLTLYSYWMFNFTIVYELGEGVVFSYTDPNTGQVINSDMKDPLVTYTNGKDTQCDILDKSVRKEKITKEGYKLIGWKEVGTDTPIVTDEENVWRFHQNKLIVTLEPVFEN